MFKTLKTTTTLAGLATLTLISTLSLEAHAQSSAQFNEAFLSAPQQFDTRRTVRRSSSSNTNDHLVGGLIGAVAGGVIGSQVAGNGARTEGSILGALIGGAAGAAIAENNNRSRQFDNHRRLGGGQRYTQTYRSDFGYAKHGNSDFEGYNRRGFYNDNLIYSGSSASGLPYYKGFGTQLGPHGSTKKTSLLGRRF